MANLPGSRPVVTLYLDPVVALLPDGSLTKFWGRFIVTFTLAFAERHHAVVLDLGPEPNPAAAVDAQSYVVAGARSTYTADPAQLPFGQLLIAPDTHPTFAQPVTFEHDYPAIARDLLAAAPDTHEVLLLTGSDVSPSESGIVAELEQLRGVREVSMVDAAAAAPHQCVVSFHRDSAEVAGLAQALGPTVPVVHQAEPFRNDEGLVFLDLLGSECGTAVAQGIARALDGESVGRVALPHRVSRWHDR